MVKDGSRTELKAGLKQGIQIAMGKQDMEKEWSKELGNSKKGRREKKRNMNQKHKSERQVIEFLLQKNSSTDQKTNPPFKSNQITPLIFIDAWMKQMHNLNSHNPCVATAVFGADRIYIFSIQSPTNKAGVRNSMSFQHRLHWEVEKMLSSSYRELPFLAYSAYHWLLCL